VVRGHHKRQHTTFNHALVGEAQRLISARFPPYAVPSRFFIVNQFELVPASGKINRRALPSVTDVAESNKQMSP